MSRIILLPPFQAGIGGGTSQTIDLGTGTSGPPGIEARIEYNGLIINDLSILDKYRVTNIDGLSDADLRDSRAINPGRHGETAFQAFYGGRTIVISGRIEANTLYKLRDMQQALRLAFSELQEKPLILHAFAGAAYDMFIYCRKGAALTMSEKQEDHRFFRDFQITLRASNPRLLTYNQKAATWTASATSASSTSMFGVSNNGTFEAEPVFALTGPMVNPQINNGTTNQKLIINATIASGNTWLIDVSKRTVKDNLGINQRSSIAAESIWPTLQPGNNAFDITATGLTVGTSSVSALWHDTWI